MDSSALAKRYIEEEGSNELADLLSRTSSLGLSVTCAPEIVSALNRRRREGALFADEYLQAREQLFADVEDAMVLDLTPAVVLVSIDLLERNVLRAMDALHVACAIEWEADLFVSSDRRQIAAAEHAGLAVVFVGRSSGTDGL